MIVRPEVGDMFPLFLCLRVCLADPTSVVLALLSISSARLTAHRECLPVCQRAGPVHEHRLPNAVIPKWRIEDLIAILRLRKWQKITLKLHRLQTERVAKHAQRLLTLTGGGEWVSFVMILPQRSQPDTRIVPWVVSAAVEWYLQVRCGGSALITAATLVCMVLSAT